MSHKCRVCDSRILNLDTLNQISAYYTNLSIGRKASYDFSLDFSSETVLRFELIFAGRVFRRDVMLYQDMFFESAYD